MADLNVKLKDGESYLYPATKATIVEEDTSHRFVTDDDIARWNSSASSTVTVTEKDIALGGDKAGALAEIVGPKQGDIAIIRELINGTKKEYTAYVYNGSAWVAMDGNYNAENVYFDKDLVTTAENVYFDKDLVTTTAIGNITLQNGQATIAAAGKNLKQVFDTIFVKEANPSVTQPSVSLSVPQAKAYEVGTTVTPSFTASLNAGSYQFGPATGITATSWSVTDSASSPAVESATGSFPELTVEDGTNYTITATAQHTEGAVPVTNIGNEYAAGKIAAGSKSKTSGAITGFRNMFFGTMTTKPADIFFGTMTTKPADITSADVRALATKQAKGNVNDKSIAIPVGALRVIFAVPSDKQITSIKDVNGLNAQILSSFTTKTVEVEGANGFSAIEYTVYYMDYASANDTANSYLVTVANA